MRAASFQGAGGVGFHLVLAGGVAWTKRFPCPSCPLAPVGDTCLAPVGQTLRARRQIRPQIASQAGLTPLPQEGPHVVGTDCARIDPPAMCPGSSNGTAVLSRQRAAPEVIIHGMGAEGFSLCEVELPLAQSERGKKTTKHSSIMAQHRRRVIIGRHRD